MVLELNHRIGDDSVSGKRRMEMNQIGYGYCLPNDFFNLYAKWDSEGHCVKKLREMQTLYFEVSKSDTGKKCYRVCNWKMDSKNYTEEEFMASHVVHEYHNGKKWE